MKSNNTNVTVMLSCDTNETVVSSETKYKQIKIEIFNNIIEIRFLLLHNIKFLRGFDTI